MFLKSLSLKNIRSYESLDISFKEGSTLLCGDIGAGKTTILLSIEFALFGIMRGVLSGSALLRHGKKEGKVILSFDLDGKDITIMRSLKRGSSGITQDEGYITRAGTKTDGTAVELKSIILELLGYPEELISKSKSLIFRYTVYTPQEEMKQILNENPEDRLEKLRKIFDIDKYKRIKENSLNFAKELRTEIKAESLFIENIDQLKKEFKDLTDNSVEKEKELKKLLSEIVLSKEKEKLLKIEFEKTQEQAKLAIELKNQQKLILQQKESTNRISKSYNQEIVDLKKEIENKPQEEILPKLRITEEIKKELEKYKQLLMEVDEKILKAKNQEAVINSKKEQSSKLQEDINTLENCPTCKQKVTEEHKVFVKEEEHRKLKELQAKFETIKEFLTKAEKNKELANKKIKQLEEELNDSKLIELKKKNFEEKIKRSQLMAEKLEIIKTKFEEIKTELLNLDKTEIDLLEKIKNLVVDEEKIKKSKLELEKNQSQTRTLEIKKAEINQQIKNIQSQTEKLSSELKIKEDKKKELEKKKKTETWMSKQFVNVVDVIEKNVLASIHTEFNERFQEWFNILMDDEAIQASLDDSFAPIIVQNGYDTEIHNLSGGEKTSVALAYRLALNKVINDFIGSIKTRDLIILDEPTDGFSTDQLDKVRDVLEELNCKQTILVSHEPKMESFVEHILRIRKHEHQSEII